jgi:hypothetical protein
MCGINHVRRAMKRDLARVIEPLAGYISATDEPESVLALAMEILRNELAQTKRTARECIASISRTRAFGSTARSAPDHSLQHVGLCGQASAA